MPTSRTAKNRDLLLDTGVRLMLTKGYNNSGLQEIVKEAGVPKGSFYHYFASKEVFAVEVLNKQVEQFGPVMDQFLKDESVPPISRLKNFFEAIATVLDEGGCVGGCFVGNLAQELSDQDEMFRGELKVIMGRWEAEFETCLLEAKERDELAFNIDASVLAGFILDSWEGALLRMKVTKSIAPIRSFMDVIFSSVLKGS